MLGLVKTCMKNVIGSLTEELLTTKVERDEAIQQSEIAIKNEQKALEIKNKWYEKYKQAKRNYEVAKKQAAYFQRRAFVLPVRFKERIAYILRLIFLR